MVRNVLDCPDFSVKVIVYRRAETETIVIGGIDEVSVLDATDYAVQAQGYFRFHIQEMDAERIEIDIRNLLGTIQLIEITRD